MNKIFEIIKHPSYIPYFLDKKRIITLPDKIYLKIMYKKLMGEKLNLKEPKNFNQKLQWLKLYDRKEIYTTMVDKAEVKKYVGTIIGDEHIIPTIGVYDSFDEINFELLPNQFVMKCTHDSGGLIICTDKTKFDYDSSKQKMEKCLAKEFFYAGREWPYKNVKPRIIIEKYMNDYKSGELIDYKFYCFNGECDYVMACFDRQGEGVKFFYYDKNWNLCKSFSKDGLRYGNQIKLPRPKNLDKMFEFAEKLSKNIPFVRVDFYDANGIVYFGEMTFFPSAGFDDTRTPDITEYLDNKLKIKQRRNI